jgi:hypothetical protein
VVTGSLESAGVIVSNSSYGAQVSNMLAGLENSGALTNVVELNNTFSEVFFSNTSRFGAYELQEQVFASVQSNSVAEVNATSTVSLPKTITMSINGQKFPISIPQRNYTLTLIPIEPRNAIVPVTIHTLVYASGTIANGQITITPK